MNSTHISARIFRYDPTIDVAPHYDTIEVPFEPKMRVLDVLEYAAQEARSGLAFRYFCGVKRCGMCGVNVNGKAVLACWEEATPSMVIEPLGNMPVIRDLTVDRSAFERSTVQLEPRLIRRAPYTSFPEAITHQQVHDSYRLMNCIECYVCSSTCPAVPASEQSGLGGHSNFVGPGTLVQIAKVALHPKDELDRSGLLEDAGIENCMSCYRCEEVCPVHIPIVTGAILPLRAIASRGPRRLARFPLDFAENIRANVDVHSATLFFKTHSIWRVLAAFPLLWRMLVRRKIPIFARSGTGAKRAVDALFKEATPYGVER